MIAVGQCAINGGPFRGGARWWGTGRSRRPAGGPLGPRLPTPPADQRWTDCCGSSGGSKPECRPDRNDRRRGDTTESSRGSGGGFPYLKNGPAGRIHGVPFARKRAFVTTVRSRLLLPALALLLFATPSARAAWQPQGNPVCTANATQQQHAGCPDGSGGVYIVWADLRGGAAQMYAQHLLSDGSIAPGWPSQGVQVTNEFLAQLPAAVPDGAGGLLVIAQVGSNLVAQRIEPSGSIAPGFPPNGIALTSDLTNAQLRGHL